MSSRTQCDNCNELGPVPPEGWIIALVIEKADLAAGIFACAATAEPGHFCSWKCMGEYASARALVESAGTEASP